MSHPSSASSPAVDPPAGSALHPSRGHGRRDRAALALVPSPAPDAGAADTPDTADTADTADTPDTPDTTGTPDTAGAAGGAASADEAGDRPRLRLVDEGGSLVTEYGLIAVVAATVAGVIIQWASGGALVTLFNALLRQARELVGA